MNKKCKLFSCSILIIYSVFQKGFCKVRGAFIIKKNIQYMTILSRRMTVVTEKFRMFRRCAAYPV